MTGRPKAKARLESERAKQRARGRFTDSEKRAILARAETVGPKVAAEEAGVGSVSTLRTWRRRLPAEVEVPVVGVASAGVGSDSPTSAVSLRAAADRERVAMSSALVQADKLLARGMASEARNASVVAGVRADRARELEDSARVAELHEAALSEAMGGLVVAAIERGFADLGLPVPSEFVGALLGGWPAPVDEGVVLAARELVRGALREEFRAELAAAEEVVDPDPPDVDAGVPGEPPDDAGEVAPEDEEPVVESEQDGEAPLRAPRRVARSDWKLPQGWDRAGGGRRGGPAGRAGP